MGRCTKSSGGAFELFTFGHLWAEIMDGVFPPKAKAMVKEFVLKYQKELNEMWETEESKKLPPLD